MHNHDTSIMFGPATLSRTADCSGAYVFLDSKKSGRFTELLTTIGTCVSALIRFAFVHLPRKANMRLAASAKHLYVGKNAAAYHCRGCGGSGLGRP
jgi:hypothetical protein